MKKLISFLLISLAIPIHTSAQQLDFPKSAHTKIEDLQTAMPQLAKKMIEIYKEDDRQKYLDHLFRLQMIATNYNEAIATIRSLREVFKVKDPSHANMANMVYEIFCSTRVTQTAKNISFEDAFQQSFRNAYSKLNDTDAYRVSWSFGYNLARAQNALQQSLENLKDRDSIDLNEALQLVQQYQPYQVYKLLSPLTSALIKEDENRRYIIQDDVLIKTKEGATLSAIVVRKKGIDTPQPAALCFTSYTDLSLNLALQAASYGYVGVTAETRGKRLSPDEIDPYEHVARDAYGVIDWISKQPWCNGKVGMYGGSYSGFAAWAATKTLHQVLKTIVPYVANNPGDGLPMENNIFLFVNYAWAFYVTNNKYLDNTTYFDSKRWGDLNNRWYQSGKSYREIDRVDGTPNKWLQRWLQHPSYDEYWQRMVPYKQDFARINIPVLTITGYYDDGQQSALHYLKEHYKHNKNADHYLLIGPYDHFGAQSSRKPWVLRGYTIDPVAQMDTPEITFQWMDFILRNGAKLPILADKMNYELMGANEWRHAPSLEKMSNSMLTLYLTNRSLEIITN
ncbi:CocE/NonD family hydrolase [bacterium]|nr:CocE/NonD family hydrolase [bacterium]